MIKKVKEIGFTKPVDKKVIPKSKILKKSMNSKEREELLIENFVGLQKAMTNLSIKFEQLSDNISKLLGVFELSAKNLIEGGSKESDADLLRKIDSLLDQNKTIAKGLVLMEGKLRGRAGAVAQPPRFARPRPLPRI